MRYGLLGGSFDPVHHGHLLLARDALERGRLDRIGFLPAAQAPLKAAGAPEASAEDRAAMLRLAIQGIPAFEVLDDELQRGGVSYTVDTLRTLQARWPERQLFWILGGDQVAQLPRWREYEALPDLVTFLCLRRPGYEVAIPPGLPTQAIQWVSARQLDLSSTEIRQRARAGLPLDFFLPPAVAAYIREHQLYQG